MADDVKLTMGHAAAAVQPGESILRPLLEPGVRLEGVYIHVPFCFHKCHYCDFYSFVDTRDQQGAFTARLCDELRTVGPSIRSRVRTIFIGGGTPTLLAVEHWRRLLDVLRETLPLDEALEFTVEANPETVTPELARVLVEGGVNRVSLGAQSFQPELLRQLERWHDPANVARSMVILRDAGVKQLNLDLIFAIPTQTLDDWRADLETALALTPEHLSCYGLMYEPNTPLTVKLRAGRIVRAEEDLEADMYELLLGVTASAGFEQYEISNFAKPGSACQHNLVYWRNENWWAFGPSASGHVDGLRWKNVPRLGDYLAHRPWAPIMDVERLDESARIGEWLMLRLRLNEGIAREELAARLVSGDQRWVVIARHVEIGLLGWRDDRLMLTSRGRLVADEVLADLV